VLKVEALCKTFGQGKKGGGVRAVDDLSFELEEGEFFTLLGPSGCGKTSTLRCIAGLEKPDSGRISVGETVVYSSTDGILVQPNDRQLGMVFQSYAIWPHMNVFDNVAFPLRTSRYKARKVDVQNRVERALETVELGHLAGRFAPQLSGGQQQRLALARALVIEPSLLLLDEPLSNLDAKLRESLRFELKRLQRDQGITTLYVTHDQSEALAFSNRIAVMSNGRIKQLGPPREVYLEPADAFVADFVGTTNFLPGTLTEPPRESRPVSLIATTSGPLAVARITGVDVGQPCIVSIRPEHVEMLKLGATSEGEPNTWKGTVQNRLFMGEVMDYQVLVGDVMLRCRSSVFERFSTGEDVLVRLDPQRCVALPPSAA
jgi:iron(III) transport system ATP-binding protein